MKAETTSRNRRETIAQAILVGAIVLGGALGAGSAALKALDVSMPRPLLVALALALTVIAAWSSLVYWRNLDEAAREAHKFAWFWGAGAGILAAAPIMALLSTGWLRAVYGPLEPNGWVILGMLTVLALQVTGYGIAWVGWWWIRRR